MGLRKHTYSMQDLEEQALETAPSLDLPGLAIEKFYMPKDNGKYMLFLANVKKSIRPKQCPYCQENDSIVFAGRTPMRLIHDVVRNNYRVDIAVQPVRLQCKKCEQRFVPRIPGIEDGKSMTKRLFEFLKTESFLQPFSTLSERSGVSIESIRCIMLEESIKYDLERDANPPTAPRVLGIDEKHITHEMRGTLVDIETGQLLDMLEDNKRDTMIGAIMGLKDYHTKIEVVTTDMNNAYLKWIPTVLPNAICVIDKFHVIQDIQQRISTTSKKLYEFRKNLIKDLEDSEERIRQETILGRLASNKRLFNYNMENVLREDKATQSRDIAEIINEFPEFRLLRELYYAVEVMYLEETYEEAEEAWDRWMELLPPTGNKQYGEWCDLYGVIPPLFDDFRSFKRSGFQFFKPYILNYFRPGCRVTNAAAEGLNKLIGNIDAAGNGYSFDVLRAKCLYASLVHERIFYGIDTKTIKAWTPTTSFMFSNSFDLMREKTVYSFTSDTRSVQIEPMNIYAENKSLLDLITSSPDTEKEVEDMVYTKSIIDDATAIFTNIWCDEESDCEPTY